MKKKRITSTYAKVHDEMFYAIKENRYARMGYLLGDVNTRRELNRVERVFLQRIYYFNVNQIQKLERKIQFHRNIVYFKEKRACRLIQNAWLVHSYRPPSGRMFKKTMITALE